MPVVYQASCNRCGHAGDIFPAAHGAVLVGRPPSGEVALFALGPVKLSPPGDEGSHLVALALPLEGHILEELGFSWDDLAREGRLVGMPRVGCRDCGEFFDVRRLAHPSGFACGSGCLAGLAAGAGVGIPAQNFWVGLGAAYAATLATASLLGAVATTRLRVRFRERAEELDGPENCPRCGSGRLAQMPSRRPLPCPACGERAVRVRSVGKS